MSNMKRKGTQPSIEKIRLLADYLDVTVDELIGEEKKPAPVPKSEDGTNEERLMAAFWGGDKDLSPEDMDAMWSDVKKFAAFIAEKRKQEKQNND